MKHIPNLFTLLNLVCGCLAAVFALQNGIDIIYPVDGGQFVKLTENICLASVFIMAAAVIDFLDGFVARLFRASSEMGKQLDSLADIVSFGVAPGIILYQFLRMAFIRENDGMETSFVWLVPVFMYTAAGAYRLARFNIDAGQRYGFKGVPIPAAGLVVASMPFIYWTQFGNDAVYQLLSNKWVIYGIALLLSWLMVSRLPMLALKFKDYSFKNNLPFILLLFIAIIAILLCRWLAVPAIFIAYIVLSLVFKNKITKTS